MLDKLDNIPWHILSHAYGPATDTPQHLRNLIHPDPVVSKQAHSALSASIVHQDWVSPAAIAAFPYLLQISLAYTDARRSYAAVLVMIIIEEIALPHLSSINYPYFLHINREMAYDSYYTAARTRIYPFIVEHFSRLLPLLHDPDIHIVSIILKIIACCVTTNGSLWEQIVPYALAERRLTVQAGYQLVAWRSGNPMALAWVAETFAKSQESLVTLTAALVLAQTVQPIPEAVTTWLIATIQSNDQMLIEAYNALGLTRRYWFDCALALYYRPLHERISLTQHCLMYLDLCGPFLSDEDIAGLLIIAFGRFHYKKSAIEHAAIQSTVVRWLAQRAFTTPEGGYGVPEGMLRAFGLPWKPAAINGFLRLPNAEHPGFGAE